MSKRVLIVDDDSRMLSFLERRFIRSGFQPSTASSGEEALAILKEGVKDEGDGFSLIFIDLYMPGMDGSELCKRIRLFDSETAIYGFAGYEEPLPPKLPNRSDFTGFFQRPLNLPELLAASAKKDPSKLGEVGDTFFGP